MPGIRICVEQRIINYFAGMKQLLISGLGLFCFIFHTCAQERFDPGIEAWFMKGNLAFRWAPLIISAT